VIGTTLALKSPPKPLSLMPAKTDEWMLPQWRDKDILAGCDARRWRRKERGAAVPRDQ